MDNIPKMTFQMDRADTGAIELGKKMGNMFITPEHLLLAFIDQGYLTFPLMMCGGDDFKLKKVISVAWTIRLSKSLLCHFVLYNM